MSAGPRLNWRFLRAYVAQRAPEAIDLAAATLCGLTLYGSLYAFIAGRWVFGIGFALVAIAAVADCMRQVERAIARRWFDDGTSSSLPEDFDA